MRKLFSAIALFLGAIAVHADQLFPTAAGTNWEYRSTETFTAKEISGRAAITASRVPSATTNSGTRIGFCCFGVV